MNRARDAYDALCRLYGEHNAQSLMKIHGACSPRVASLARAFGRSRAAVKASKTYGMLTSLNGGFLKLMTACGNDGSVRRIVDVQSHGRNFLPWEIDTAVKIVQVISERNGA